MREARHSAPLGADVARAGEVDAVVVGSGAGGGPVALALARAGYRVVVLEKGPAYDQRDFVNDEIALCRRDFFVPFLSDEPHVIVEGGRPRTTNHGWTACCVGGGTVHMAGFAFRLHPEDLKSASLYGAVEGASVADWPLRWDELLPYYERVEIEIGVSGDGAKNPFERFRRPHPLPPLPENGMAVLVEEGCRKLGLHPYPTARMIVSRAWQGRAQCQLSHFCASYGCETGAKSSSLAALIPKAVATGRCQVRPLAHAHTIELENGRASGVRYLDAAGKEHRLRAAVVVVACSPIESARLLLHSRVPDASGQLGRNLMCYTLGTGIGAFDRSDPRLKKIDWRQPFINRSFQDMYLIEEKGAKRKGGTGTFLFPHVNPIFTAERLATGGPALLWGAPLKRALRRHYREVQELEFEFFSETMPTSGSRVTLDPRAKDRFGLPVARFEIQPHPRDAEVSRALVDRGMEVLRAMGAREVRATAVGDRSFYVQAGTCRFGDDPATSVLDRDCRFHGVRNLFVSDGSFMPTSGGGSNTLTVLANALRVGERIVALGRTHELFTRGGKK